MQWQRNFPKFDTVFHPLSGQDWGIRIRGAENWKKFLNEMAENVGPDSRFIGEVGKVTIEWIESRVLSGRDYHDKPMAPYTEKYAEFKRRLGLGAAVNMHLYGPMYRSLTYRVIPMPNGVGVRLFFNGTFQDVKAWVHQTGAISGRRRGRFHQKVREHFGLTDKNEQDLEVMFYDALANWLSRCWR